MDSEIIGEPVRNVFARVKISFILLNLYKSIKIIDKIIKIIKRVYFIST